jgi:hypothetical protein
VTDALFATAAGPPTSVPQFSQEKWSGQSCDRNFNNAWGDSSPLELGRVMPNECWLRWQTPLMKSEGVPYTVKSSSTEGPTRRDPLGISSPARAASTAPHRSETRLQNASAMGSSASHDRRPWQPGWDALAPRRPMTGVAPYGVSTVIRLAHTNRARSASGDTTYEVQETDGGRPSERRAPHATAGDGCPSAVHLKSAARSSQRGCG